MYAARELISDCKTTAMIFSQESHSFGAQLIAHLKVWSIGTHSNIKYLRKNRTQGRVYVTKIAD